MTEDSKFGGFACPMDGTGCQTLTGEQAEALWNHAKEKEAERARNMPTERDAIDAMFQAYQRLRELGWREAMYCPKDGRGFKVIESGSTGIFDCTYQGEWPKGTYWISDKDDVYSSNPCLFKESA